MSLASYVPPRADVTMAGKGNPLTVSVRGLNLDDISLLVATHIDEFRAVAELWEGASAEIFASIQKDNFIVKLVTQVPSMAATVISLAADEPDSRETVRTLPIAFQVKLLLEIVRLTLEDAGGPKGFAALLKTMMDQQPPAATALN